MMTEWRYRCPNGHTTWHARSSGMKESGGSYYCDTCQRHDGVSPHFETLIDTKTGQPVTGDAE